MISIDIQKSLNGESGTINLDVKLKLKQGDFIALTGKSGSGKTTLLRIIAGLEEAKGTITVNDKIWQKDKFILPPQKRNIGFVFQDYALFPNMSVEKNLLFVNNDKTFANHLLNITELTSLKNQLPHKLSGGQKQRVALCRALMNKPNLLLMDEPLSALDKNIREKLQLALTKLHKELKMTIIIVSHDLNEINNLTNRTITLNNGATSET